MTRIGRLKRPRLLIVGCGDIGKRIVARLASRFRILACVRRPDDVTVVRHLGAVPLIIDLDRPDSLYRLTGLAPNLMYLAPTSPEGIHDHRARALQAILSRSRPGPPGKKRWVYVSTTGVYGDRQGARVSECTPARPGNDRARRRLDAENHLRRRKPHARVIRAPGIYAADRLPLDRLRQQLPVPAQAVYTNHIHADDLAGICLSALFRGASARVYNAVDDTDMPLADYLDMLADHVALPRPPRASPAALEAALSAARLRFLQESRRIANTRLKRELGYRLRYANAREALASPSFAPLLVHASNRPSTDR